MSAHTVDRGPGSPIAGPCTYHRPRADHFISTGPVLPQIKNFFRSMVQTTLVHGTPRLCAVFAPRTMSRPALPAHTIGPGPRRFSATPCPRVSSMFFGGMSKPFTPPPGSTRYRPKSLDLVLFKGTPQPDDFPDGLLSSLRLPVGGFEEHPGLTYPHIDYFHNYARLNGSDFRFYRRRVAGVVYWTFYKVGAWG